MTDRDATLAQAYTAGRNARDRGRNRDAFPVFTEYLDAIRASLPDPDSLRVRYVKEGDKEVGRIPEDDE